MIRPCESAGAGVPSTLPYARFSPNLYPACQNAFRGADGECFDRPVSSAAMAAATHSAKKTEEGQWRIAQQRAGRGQFARRPRTNSSPKSTAHYPTPQADELARRHGLERVASQNFPLLGGTIGLFRIIDRRPVDTVRREFAADGSVRSVQLNFRYLLQDQKKPVDRG